jgi:hypothetical protein
MSISYEKAIAKWSERWFQFILNHPEKDWDWKELSANPNITLEIIEKYIDKPWNWYLLSRNIMSNERDNFIRKELQKQFRESHLLKEMMEKIWHPKNYQKFAGWL